MPIEPTISPKENCLAHESDGRVAILYPGDAEARRSATATNNRFAPLFSAFAASRIDAEPAVYHDDFCHIVRDQLLAQHGDLSNWPAPGK